MFTWIYPYFLLAICVMSDSQGTLAEKTFGPVYSKRDAEAAAVLLWYGYLCESRIERGWVWKEAIPINIPQ